MAGTERPRDWDKELAEVDKLLSKLPNADPTLGRAVPAARAAAPATSAAAGGSAVGTWLRVGLAVALAVGMTLWPYPRPCGLQLVYYAGGLGMLVFAGLWGAVASWRRRSATGHLLSLGALVWGFALVTAVVLPRIGYAKQPATWTCP
jgi:hypothetical protein